MGCYKGVVTKVVRRFSTGLLSVQFLKRRVEQKVVKAANVSLLALYKERKERP